MHHLFIKRSNIFSFDFLLADTFFVISKEFTLTRLTIYFKLFIFNMLKFIINNLQSVTYPTSKLQLRITIKPIHYRSFNLKYLIFIQYNIFCQYLVNLIYSQRYDKNLKLCNIECVVVSENSKWRRMT